MSLTEAKVTERSFYPPLMKVLESRGLPGVSEATYNSEPDIVFELGGQKWLLSVKIGETASILKSAFIQYQRHKDESHLAHGMVLFLPESARSTAPESGALDTLIDSSPVTCLIDTPQFKEEFRQATFPLVVSRLQNEVLPKVMAQVSKAYPMTLVISLLKENVTDLMKAIRLSDPVLLKVITDQNLLTELGHINPREAEAVTRFLASYIVLSQMLFLRLLSTAQPGIISGNIRPVSHHSLRRAFGEVLRVDYRPIYALDVLDSLSEEYLRDTYDLIWGLQVEQVKYELPGRVFHELMPPTVRKMLAAFYTRPQAADLLAHLCIGRSVETVLDPACGSGTILTSAYRRKLELWQQEGHSPAGNPHKRFCEEEIFGADIMPFALHLTGANLAAMDAGTTIDRTQLILGDSLDLSQGEYRSTDNIQLSIFPAHREAKTTNGETYQVSLDKVNTILMNPPFTKVERGIKDFVNMERFSAFVGGEVGLWGHFIALADEFLEDGGVYGAVLPINVLRGRESSKVRDLLFRRWTPLYVLKPTVNYGFSEWSEYRDVLLICRKATPTPEQQVKFCLVKRDLNELRPHDASHIARQVVVNAHLRSPDLDIDSYPLSSVLSRSANLMWFCSGVDLNQRGRLAAFVNRLSPSLARFRDGYVRSGYRAEGGASSILFISRNRYTTRTENAFLVFEREDNRNLYALSPLGVGYKIEKTALKPSLRTGVGIDRMNLAGEYDYVAVEPYRELSAIMPSSRFRAPKGFDEAAFWRQHKGKVSSSGTHLAVVCRLNPYSPATHLLAFASAEEFAPQDVLNIIVEPDSIRAKATCAVLNSVVFLSQLFLSKEETTGRYIHVRSYDLEEMLLWPGSSRLDRLAGVYDANCDVRFPSLRDQLDQDFAQRYSDFQNDRKGKQVSLLRVVDKPVSPSSIRIQFDLAVCEALGVSVTEQELVEVYQVIVEEMMVTRALTRD